MLAGLEEAEEEDEAQMQPQEEGEEVEVVDPVRMCSDDPMTNDVENHCSRLLL